VALDLQHLDEDPVWPGLVIVGEVRGVGLELDLDRGSLLGPPTELGDPQPCDRLAAAASQVAARTLTRLKASAIA